MKNELMPVAIQRLMPSFEPRPTVTAYYYDDVHLDWEKSFEPRPTVTSYHDNEASLKEEKSFEPRPNVSVYTAWSTSLPVMLLIPILME